MAFSISIFKSPLRWLKTRTANGKGTSSGDEALRLLAENSSDVVFHFGMDGRARYISPSVQKLFGFSAAEIYATGGNIVSNGFLHPDDQAGVTRAVEAHFAGQLPEVKLEFRIVHRNGQHIWVQTNCSTILDAADHPTAIIFTMRDIAERKAVEMELEKLARTDGLTGLANRRAFDEQLEHEWRRAMRENTELSLLVVDADHFKAFNDANGHQVGDDCLRTLAGTMLDMFKRAGDLPARYGGEEFAVILPGTSQTAAFAIAEDLRKSIEALRIPNSSHLVSGTVTVSIGLATAIATSGGTSGMQASLLAAADAALYKAKAEGRNRVVAGLCLTPSSDLKAA